MMVGACGVLIWIHAPTQLGSAIEVKCSRLVFDQQTLGGGGNRRSDLARPEWTRLSEDVVAEIAAARSIDTDAESGEALTAERSDHRSEASMTTIATVGAQSRRAFWECDIIECDDQLFTSTLESAEKRLDRHAGVIHLTRREYQ